MTNTTNNETIEPKERLNFVEEVIEEAIAKGKTKVQTRFPPEPNVSYELKYYNLIC